MEILLIFIWSGRRDSNSRHLPWQGNALPLSHSRIFVYDLHLNALIIYQKENKKASIFHYFLEIM